MSGAEPVFGPRDAQPLNDLLRQSEAIDLNALEKILDPRGTRELETALNKVAPIALALAMSADGRELLEWLCDMTIRRPVFVSGKSIEEAALYAAHREGQNAVVGMILKAVKAGEEALEEAQKRS